MQLSFERPTAFLVHFFLFSSLIRLEHSTNFTLVCRFSFFLFGLFLYFYTSTTSKKWSQTKSWFRPNPQTDLLTKRLIRLVVVNSTFASICSNQRGGYIRTAQLHFFSLITNLVQPTFVRQFFVPPQITIVRLLNGDYKKRMNISSIGRTMANWITDLGSKSMFAACTNELWFIHKSVQHTETCIYDCQP